MLQVLICACARCSRALHGTFGWRVSARHATVLSPRCVFVFPLLWSIRYTPLQCALRRHRHRLGRAHHSAARAVYAAARAQQPLRRRLPTLTQRTERYGSAPTTEHVHPLFVCLLLHHQHRIRDCFSNPIGVQPRRTRHRRARPARARRLQRG